VRTIVEQATASAAYHRVRERLIHGAGGVTYFVHSREPSFREDGIFGSAAMVTAVTALNQQVRSLAPVLNSATLPNVVAVTSSNSAAPIDMMTKAKGQVLYIFAAIARAGTTTGTFAIAGLTGDGSASVAGESRAVPIVAGKLIDDFAASAVHIYQIDLGAITCR